MKIKFNCKMCGTAFTLTPAQVAQGRGTYCSRKCMGLGYRRGESYIRTYTSETGAIAEHRKVWQDAHGPIPAGYEVHHINENVRDNRLENLELLTKAAHISLHKRGKQVGEAHGRAVLTEAMVREIRQRYAAGGISQWQLSWEYPCSRSTIGKILTNRLWTHLTEQ